MPVHSNKWMLRRQIAVGWGVLKRSKQMRRRIGITHAYVDERDAQPRHRADPFQWLRKIRQHGIIGARSPGGQEGALPRTGLADSIAAPLLKWDAVEAVHARGNKKLRDPGTYSQNNLA